MPITVENPATFGLLNALNNSTNIINKSIERVSTGKRVNSAADDAAALSIINRLSAEISGLEQASRNINSAISVTQTAEGALDESSSILIRARELAVQAANGSLSDSQRSQLQTEFAELKNEFTRIASTTTLGGNNLLDGTFSNQTFQVGENSSETISLSIPNAKANSVGQYNVSSNTAASTLGAVTGSGANFQQNNFAGQTLTINGNETVSTGVIAAGSSAYTVAQAINSNSGLSGVTATASTTATLNNLSADGTVSFNLQGDTAGGSVSISASVTTTDLSNLASAINQESSTTGITASSNGGTLTLTNNEGYDIAIEDFANSAGGVDTIDFGTSVATTPLSDNGTNDSATVGGTVEINSTTDFSISSDTGTTFLASSPTGASLESFASADISTQQGASDAISIIDYSLTRVDEIRTTIGAFQNRITSALDANTYRGINATSARSQLEDADLALEIARLTRGQILQQAAISIFAQSNSNQQSVLSLLSSNGFGNQG